MTIRFSADRWDTRRANARAWWAHELERPLVHLLLYGAPSDRDKPKYDRVSPSMLYDESVDPDDIIDSWDYEFSTQEYLGDAFPAVWPNMGPGVLAACVGGYAECATEQHTVWFYPHEEKELADLSFTYDPDSLAARRMRAIYKAGVDRWDGMVTMGMGDLGGTMDVLSTFRPSEKLLLDLYDSPDEVHRCMRELHEAWHAMFNDMDSVLQPGNKGYGAWTPIYSETPSYMLQCDFAYMLGPDMYNTFVHPELKDTCDRLGGNAFYHLDGLGQLAHLPYMLEIDTLAGIQWVPGTGKTAEDDWLSVHNQILDAGKLLQIYDWAQIGSIKYMMDNRGDGKGIIALASGGYDQRDLLIGRMEALGLPVVP